MRIITSIAAAGAMALAAGSAWGADLAIVEPEQFAPPPAHAPATQHWDGLYGTLLGGYGWAGSQTHFNDNNGFVTALGNVEGSLFGGGVGWNHTYGRLLFGIEADAATTEIEASLTNCLGNNLNRGCSADVDNIMTARVRFGMTFGDNNHFLVFAAGGLAWSEVTLTTFRDGGPTVTDSVWNTGWTAGGGIEFFVPHHERLSARAEYLYVDIPTRLYVAGVGDRELGFGAGMHILRFGLSLHFN